MNKKELTELIKKLANHYGERVSCEWLSPDGCEWIKWDNAEITAEFMRDVEKGNIRNIHIPKKHENIEAKNILETVFKMAQDNNQGVAMSKTVTGVDNDFRGYIVSFGVEGKERANSAINQSVGLPSDHICVAFFIDKKELEKYK